MPAPPRAILFDLDGTLADSAPDLAAAVNRMRSARELPPLPYPDLRPHASSGARGMLAAAFGMTPAHAGYEDAKAEFLALYEADLVRQTQLFDGVPPLLDALAGRGIAWGIVTNKMTRLAAPLVQAVGLGHAGCLVGGDTTAFAKPHPAPLLEAARRLGVAPEACWYVGDDLRDIEAGRAAGMRTVAAAWGYCGLQAPQDWGADWLLAAPGDLIGLLAGA